MKPEVFLGGACGCTTWRQEIAIPVLNRSAVTFFNPQLGLGEWTTAREPEEMQAKADAAVLLFVLMGETRGVATVGEIAYYLAAHRRLALVITDIPPSAEFEGRTITPAECDDLNRGRIFVRTMAREQGVPVFTDIEAATDYAVQLAKDSRNELNLQKLSDILRDISYRNCTLQATETSGGFLLQISSRLVDALTGVPGQMEGRQWYLPRNATESEVVRTALKAVLTWEEHEAREHFQFRGVRPFHPHTSIRTED